MKKKNVDSENFEKKEEEKFDNTKNLDEEKLLFVLKMKKGYLSDTSLIKKLKKSIARNKTLKNK